MGRLTAASRLYSSRRAMKRLNGKEDISIPCEILLLFISVFFFPTLIAFPVVSSDRLHVTRAQLYGWCFNVRLLVFFLVLRTKRQAHFVREEEKASGPPPREPNHVRAFTGRVPSWLELKFVEQRLLKNNGGCWPSTKCQRRLWELLEIPIERATFPRVRELVSQQTTRRDQQGQATGSRQTGKLLNLRPHFQPHVRSDKLTQACFFALFFFPRSAQSACLNLFFERLGTSGGRGNLL